MSTNKCDWLGIELLLSSFIIGFLFFQLSALMQGVCLLFILIVGWATGIFGSVRLFLCTAAMLAMGMVQYYS